MPRTDITITASPHEAAINPVAEQAADSTNDMRYKNTGREVLTVNNGGAGAVNVTIQSVADEAGRLGNIVASIAAGAVGSFDMLQPRWWNQTAAPDAGFVQIDFDIDTSVTVWCIRYPQ